MTVTSLDDELRALLPDVVVADPTVLRERSADRSGVPPLGEPAALVRARATDDVAAVLRFASAHAVPVVPQGALTGLAGGANAVPGGDPARPVGPGPHPCRRRGRPHRRGAAGRARRRPAARRGRARPVLRAGPRQRGEATIGGTVATNAGGMRCLKGVSRDAVRSLEVVLADGEVVRTRPATVKGVAGLDLTSLVVGSKGTLAVVTEVTVSLRGSPRARRPGCSPSPTSATRQRPPPRGTPSPVQPGDARAARGSINEDISAPRSRLLELVERVEALSAEIGLVIAVGGHVGDGNLHPVVSFDPADAAQVAAARRAHERILELAGELGGGDR